MEDDLAQATVDTHISGRGRECLESGRSDLSVAERYVAELLTVV